MMSEAMFDSVSVARRGPGRRDKLSQSEIAQIAQTTRQAPEAIVKVLPKGATTSRAVRRHLDYVGRHGELELETDDGNRLHGDYVGAKLTDELDLDIEEDRRQSNLSASHGRAPAKLVHKFIFSMPPGTSPNGVLAGVPNFAREEFALKHRYAFALHSDEPHPHVHVVVKAMGEHGQRVNIRKALREWRSEFARHLRDQGIPANATPRHVRGEPDIRKPDRIYRANVRGEPTYMRACVEAIARELAQNKLKLEQGKATLVKARKRVLCDWLEVSDILKRAGQQELAAHVRRFLDEMPPPQPEKESIANQMLGHRRRSITKDEPITR